MKDYILTPEAISEMIYEYWNDLSSQRYKDSETWQEINLEQNSLYYIAISNEDEEREALKKDETKNNFSLNEINIENLKSHGLFNKHSSFILEKYCKKTEDIIFAFPGFIFNYYQIKGSDVENYIIKVLKIMLTKKIALGKKLSLKYCEDMSTKWYYHVKSDKPLLHVFLSCGECADNPIILNSCFNTQTE